MSNHRPGRGPQARESSSRKARWAPAGTQTRRLGPQGVGARDRAGPHVFFVWEKMDASLDDDLLDLSEEEVLEQLQELHRQLANRRQTQRDLDPGVDVDAIDARFAEQRDSLLAPPKKLIVCAVRKPVQLEKPFGEETFVYRESASGLKAAVDALKRSGVQCRWVAWPGCFVEKTSQEGVRSRLEEEHNCQPVFLDRDLEDLFYARFCPHPESVRPSVLRQRAVVGKGERRAPRQGAAPARPRYL